MNTPNYFINCKTAAEAKALWKELAKTHHPDKGGSNEVMQEINAQYIAFQEKETPNYTKSEKFKIDITEYADYLEKMFPGQPWVLFFQGGPVVNLLNDLINGSFQKNWRSHAQGILEILPGLNLFKIK